MITSFFRNPVLKTDFPDPCILQVDDTYYAYATNGNGKNIQTACSNDLVHWKTLEDALPSLPTWAQTQGGFVWAPAVIQIGNKYVMYYTARDKRADKQCIGVAVSESPEGAFKDISHHPLICQVDQGGSIDPSPFKDGNRLYLYFKNDGNSCSLPTYLYVQELSSDGLNTIGNPIPLIRNDQPWEGNVIEAPEMFKHEGKYYLFFSANDYTSSKYAVGYAMCQTPTGPCQKAAENPILISQNPSVIGPGGQTVFLVGNQTWILYHAWEVKEDSSRGDSRFMWLDRITWQDDKPHIHGPTTELQPMPNHQIFSTRPDVT